MPTESGMRVDLATGSARYSSNPPETTATISSIEIVIGTDGTDILRGDKHANTLRGGGGDDILSGRGGNDRLSGGPGRDKLRGGAGRDVLSGGSGRDNLGGGPGRDRNYRRIRSRSLHQPRRRTLRDLMRSRVTPCSTAGPQCRLNESEGARGQGN